MLVLDSYVMAVIKKSDFFCTYLIHMHEIRWEFLMKMKQLLF